MKKPPTAPSVIYIPVSSHKATPWKNGGGSTVQLHIEPHSANLEDFDWRLSMATVAVDGPFSTFQNIDRTLTVLSGNGISLDIEGNEGLNVLQKETPPFSFPADIKTNGRLGDGPITDLNMMSVREKVSHSVRRVALFEEQDIVLEGQTTILFAETNGITITLDKTYPLSKNDCLIVSGDLKTARIKPAGLEHVIVITVSS